MNWWQRLCATTVLALLQGAVKNPQSLQKEFGILREIRDAITSLIGPN